MQNLSVNDRIAAHDMLRECDDIEREMNELIAFTRRKKLPPDLAERTRQLLEKARQFALKHPGPESDEFLRMLILLADATARR